MTTKHKSPTVAPVQTALSLAIMVVLVGSATFGTTAVSANDKKHDDHGQRVCAETAKLGFKACGNDVMDNYLIASAKCLNLRDEDEKDTCFDDAKSERNDEKQLCGEIREARLEVCDALTIGSGPYDPPIDPQNFVPASEIVGNNYFPLTPRTMIYKNTDGETITVTYTTENTTIMGVPVVVVSDVVELDGEAVEDTVDWYAQDKAGNVWYFGEISFSANEENKLISVDGSWEAGVDGAKPGIIMPAGIPTVGDVFRQEWLMDDAEDVAEILSTTESEAAAAFGCSGDCVKTHDFSPIEPDASESKFYAPGVGVIVVLDDNDPDFREELVEIK